MATSEGEPQLWERVQAARGPEMATSEGEPQLAWLANPFS